MKQLQVTGRLDFKQFCLQASPNPAPIPAPIIDVKKSSHNF